MPLSYDNKAELELNQVLFI